jgi:hypothetical protein
MSASIGKPGHPQRGNMPAFGTFGSQQPASLLFEKANPGLRRSTPDSEALASSDDEADQGRSATISQKLPKPTRRTSWLNDVAAANATGLNRKPSASAQYSPSASNPGTPSADQPSWPNLGNPTSAPWPTAPTSSPWTSIWSQENRGPPSRLQNVMADNQESGIPFNIPLQPTLKPYRSQSYSVGQLENVSAIQPPGQVTNPNDPSRVRHSGPTASLTRRASRTSGLGVDSGGLDRVREVDDDDEEEDTRISTRADHYTVNQSRGTARVDQDSPHLRQGLQQRDRPSSATSSTAPPTNTSFRSSRLHGSVPEEFDNAIDDQESMSGSGHLPRPENGMRRLSEQGGVPFDRQNLVAPENRNLDSTRKAQWSTSLGFGSIPEAPQSRRHSLADVPTRHGSFSSHGITPSSVPV